MEHTGGCLCGAVRYRVSGAPLWVAHCHCQSCRKASGAPVLTFAGFHADRYEITGSEPVRYPSSPGVTRAFCGRCGTPLSYEAERYAGEVHVTISSLDRPEDFPPQGHVWTEDRIPWFETADDLPRHPRTSGDDGGADPDAA